VRLAAPIAAAQSGLALMGIVDTVVVGRASAASLGALGLANGIFFAIAVIGIGTMMGLDPLLSQAFGAGDRTRTRELLLQGGWLALCAALVLALPVALVPALLAPAGIAPAVAREVTAFLHWRVPGLLPMFFFVGARAYLQAAGRVQPLVLATVAANAFNLGADLLFVYGGAGWPAWSGPLRGVPAMGAAGAGLATTLAMLVQAMILAYSAWSHAGPAPAGAARLPRLADLQKAAQVGLPVGMQMGAEVGVFALAGLLAGRFGGEALAAHQVAISLASLTFCVAVGIGAAGSVRVGLAIGRGETASARRSGLTAFALGATIMSFFGLVFSVAPGPIARLLTDRPDVLATAIPLLGVVAVFQISDGVQGIGAGVLRGAGDTLFSFLANLVGHYLVGLQLAIWLGIFLHQGIVGIWWGLCAGLTSVALALFTRFVRLSSRPIERLEHGGAAAVEPVD